MDRIHNVNGLRGEILCIAMVSTDAKAVQMLLRADIGRLEGGLEDS